MNKKIKVGFIAFLSVSLGFASCKNEAKDTVKTEDAVEGTQAQITAEYPLDSLSYINFTGYKPGAAHTGRFIISQGSFMLNSNNRIEGSFIIDMTTLEVTDGTEEKLAEHLKGEDFFDIAKFAKSTFTITSMEPGATPKDSATVSGNLELKGISKNVTFPALVTVTDSSIQTQAAFLIDRTDWNLSYGNDNSLGDRFIKPEVQINFDLKGKKK